MEKEELLKDDPVALEKLLNQMVVVSARDGRKFRGKLTQYDEHMNILLEDAEEILKENRVVKHKLILVKGGNVSVVSA